MGPGVEGLLPSLTAIIGDEDAAMGAVGECVPERADDDVVVIARVDQNPRNVPGLFEAGVGPGIATIGALVDAVAVADVVSGIRLAGSNPNRLVVGRIDCYRAD